VCERARERGGREGEEKRGRERERERCVEEKREREMCVVFTVSVPVPLQNTNYSLKQTTT
jgi:hypothetical protein